MKSDNLKTKIFLDSGDPKETFEVFQELSFLDGQTTNPSLVLKNPVINQKFLSGQKFIKDSLKAEYKKIIQEISDIIPGGAVSSEVYVDQATTLDQILMEAREMSNWAENVYVKIPVTKVGLEAAEILAREKVKLNITLIFSQKQALAVHLATLGAKKGDVLVSPFIGRLDDIGLNGLDLPLNIQKMFYELNSHVEVLAASIRNKEHFNSCLAYKIDIITAPKLVLLEWYHDANQIFKVKNSDTLSNIQFENLNTNSDWRDIDISHELTTKGLEKFVSDWNSLFK